MSEMPGQYLNASDRDGSGYQARLNQGSPTGSNSRPLCCRLLCLCCC